MTLIDKQYHPITLISLPGDYENKDIDKYKLATINRNGLINGFNHYKRDSYKHKPTFSNEVITYTTYNKDTQFLEHDILKAGKDGSKDKRCIDKVLLNHLNILTK